MTDSFEQAVRAVQGTLGSKQDKIQWKPATLGDGHGTVSTGNNMVYVRLSENSSVIEVLNLRVAPVDGLRVRIAKTPEMPLIWQVIGQDDQRSDENGSGGAGSNYNIPLHHRLHEYLGVDQVNFDWRQIINLRVTVVSSFTVKVFEGLIPRTGADLVVDTQTIDLSGDVPAAGALYDLITIDTAGIIAVTSGTLVGSLIDLTPDYIPDTPTGHFRLAAVRLYAGQSALSESTVSNDIRDLRWPQETLAGDIYATFGVQAANVYLAGPASGPDALPEFRAGVADDIQSGIFPIARGGTNANTATDAINNLLPSQSGQAGNVLGTDGSNVSWVAGGSGGTITVTSLPVGTIVPFGGSSIPSGWLECNGASVLRATYPDLFTAIGTTYGSVDGTHFTLPDLRGRMSIGQGTGSGLTTRSIGDTGGEETHTLTSAEMPAHTHLVYRGQGSGALTSYFSSYDTLNSSGDTGSTGDGDAHNNMPPFVVTAWIIKYTDTATSDLIFNDGANPETVLATTNTGDDVYAARRDHVHAITAGAAENQILQTGANPYPAQWSTNTLAIAGNSTVNGSLIGNISGGGTLVFGAATDELDISGSVSFGSVALFGNDLLAFDNVFGTGFRVKSTKAFTVNNILTLDGVDGSTLTIPATGTAALLATANVFTALQTFNGFATSTITNDQEVTPSAYFEQNATALQDGSGNTGADETIDQVYEFSKFTASGNHALRAISVSLKRSGTITSTAQAIVIRIYSDNAGVPGTPLAGSGGTSIMTQGSLTTSYQEFFARVAINLVSGNTYWIGVYIAQPPIGGTILAQRSSSGGAGSYAYSTNGSSWTNENNKTLWFKCYGRSAASIKGLSIVNYGVHGESSANYGVYGYSKENIGGYFGSRNSGGILGVSTNGVGVYGSSSTNYGGQFISSTGAGLLGSGALDGTQGTSSGADFAGLYGRNNGGGYSGYFRREVVTAYKPCLYVLINSATDAYPLILANTIGTGKLIDLQKSTVTLFQVDNTGFITSTSGGDTAGIKNILTLNASRTSAGASGDGGSILFTGKSSTSSAQSMAALKWLWNTATHASRAAQIIGTIYDTAERQWLQVDTDGSQSLTKIGDGATNYAQFAGDGTLTLVGTAKVLKEIEIQAVNTQLGVSAPTKTNRAVGASGNILLPVLQFSKTSQNDVYFEIHPRADMDGTVATHFHVMWLPGASWSTGNYVWKLEYLVKDESGAAYNTGTPTTISVDVTPSNATDTIETHFTDDIAVTYTQSIWCHFYRDVASDNADDTGDVRFFELEYVSASLGENI